MFDDTFQEVDDLVERILGVASGDTAETPRREAIPE